MHKQYMAKSTSWRFWWLVKWIVVIRFIEEIFIIFIVISKVGYSKYLVVYK